MVGILMSLDVCHFTGLDASSVYLSEFISAARMAKIEAMFFSGRGVNSS